jgi:hypothetical protein
MANTGNKVFSRLLKVIDDGTDRPLDVNNELCSVSGLPEVRKDNTSGDPDYIAPSQDLNACPLPQPTMTDYYFEGVYELNDPAHPNGGSLNYVDSNGVTQSRTAMWAGNCQLISSQSEPTNKIGVAPCAI